MEIKYSDDVVLKINITDKMVKDWKDHREKASVPGGPWKDCSTCSLNIRIEDYGICELPAVAEELNRRIGRSE